MTVFGMFANKLFHGSIPNFIHDFMHTLGSAFSASASFLIGLRMVPSIGSFLNSQKSFITPMILITYKCLVMPIVAREFVSQLDPGKTANDTLDLSNYAFLYGTIPTAPSVFVYAVNYDILPNMIANTITASTFIAVTAWCIALRITFSY